MSVWWTVPSARPNGGTVQVWKDAGYKVALWRTDAADIPAADLVLRGAYPGYYAACNRLIYDVLRFDSQCDWCVCGGDDTTPDPDHPPEGIAMECNLNFQYCVAKGDESKRTFGVMQPTGDKDFGDSQGPYIERIAGSPWIGRSFAERINMGKGPWCEEYFHMGGDEHMQELAILLGVFWQRSDLTHFHAHWGRPKPGETHGNTDNMPAFLKRANSADEWANFQKVLAKHRANKYADFARLL